MLQNRLAMCLSLGLCQSVGARSLYKIAICLCILDSVLLTGNCIDESSWLLKHSFIYKVMSSFCLSFSSIAWRRLLHQNNKKSIPKRSKFGGGGFVANFKKNNINFSHDLFLRNHFSYIILQSISDKTFRLLFIP